MKFFERKTLLTPSEYLAGSVGVNFLGVVIGLTLTSTASAKSPPPKIELCPGFTVIGQVDPRLSDVEKRLVCGDPKSDSWKDIPKNQAQFSFSTFMQDRALYHVKYTESLNHLTADVDVPTYVTSLTSEGGPPEMHLERKRKIVGEKLTPSLLDTVEQWTIKRLASIGYPCPKVKSHADPDTGEVHLVITPGPKLNLLAIHEVHTPGLAHGVIRRYDAFTLGNLYNGDNMFTTSNRIVSQGLFDSSFFIPSCQAGGVVASQEIVSSPPRLLSLGVGVNTEEFLVGRARWTQSRLGVNGSDVSVQIYSSFKSQQLSSYIDGYVFSPGSRQAIRPYVSIDHENWDAYETGTVSTQIAHETSFDWSGNGGDEHGGLGFKVITGPEIDEIRTYRGVGPATSHFLSLQSNWTLMTHDFEFYGNANAPRTGYSATLSLALANQSLYSTESVQRIDLRWEGLWNLNHFDPPLFIFGVRAGYDTTVTGERPSFANIYGVKIPPTYLHFLGGSQDLRGFGAQELPVQPAGVQNGDQIGSLTDAFVSLEARMVSVLPIGLEPFLFTDIGALGNTPWSLLQPIYWDPGFGLRLQSPIGVFRTTLAHGFIGSTPDHYQFYLSFGQEF